MLENRSLSIGVHGGTRPTELKNRQQLKPFTVYVARRDRERVSSCLSAELESRSMILRYRFYGSCQLIDIFLAVACALCARSARCVALFALAGRLLARAMTIGADRYGGWMGMRRGTQITSTHTRAPLCRSLFSAWNMFAIQCDGGEWPPESKSH